MRKKLDTRFPAARIKKIMQADEDVGKIAMAVPLLVSKALELFLQDLCDQTYEITLKRGAKTVNSSHLKQCVQSFNVFDFLKDTVSKVPDLGGSDGAAEDKSATKRRFRKIVCKLHHTTIVGCYAPLQHETGHTSNNGRCMGRVRGRGRGRGSRTLEREIIVQCKKSEDAADSSHQNGENQKENFVRPHNVAGDGYSGTTSGKDQDKSVRNFDLNVELNANGDSTSTLASAPESSTKPAPDMKCEDIAGWSLDDMGRIAIDPVQLAYLTGEMDEEDENYDEE